MLLNMERVFRNTGTVLLFMFSVYSLFIYQANARLDTVKIVGIFDENGPAQIHDAFRYAILHTNEGNRGLPGTTLVPRTIDNFRPDLLTGPQQVCSKLEEGVFGIFGASGRLPMTVVDSVAHSTKVPHIKTRWTVAQNHPETFISIHPDHRDMARALADLVRHFNWTSFALIYDDAESLMRASHLVDGTNGMNSVVYKLNGSNIISTLTDVKTSGTSFIVLDCSAKVALKVLNAANKLSLVSYYYHYVLTAWDLHLLDLNEIIPTHVNITAFQLVDVDDARVIKAARSWGAQEANGTNGKVKVTTDAALMYDAVQLLVKALKNSDEELVPGEIHCDKRESWKQGSIMRQRILKTKLKGITGDIAFDSEGRRSGVRLLIVEPLRYGLQKVGYWTADAGIRINFNYTGYRTFVQKSIKNKALRVLAKLEEPYVMKKDNFSKLFGNDRYRGYCVDMLLNLSRTLNFSYDLNVTELPYGTQDPVTKEWHGLVRELMDKNGDMVLGAMTISRDREEVVDFSQPFLYLGVQILLKKPERKLPALFSFLDPLSVDVWIFIVVGYIVMSCVMFVIGRFSPYEWYNPNPCVEEAGVVENQFSIFNAMWFAIGSLMQVGTEIAPRAISTRFLAGIWWFFTMIMVGSYTANLAAYLTAERMKLPIENAHDLVSQNQIKYGCLEGGATCKFFEKSVHPDYMRMWDTMNADQSNFVKSNKDGIAKVKESTPTKGYAFLMESITLEYETSRDCNITGIGNHLDTKGYGVAFPKNSPFREEISVSILTQQDRGFLEEFHIKWWKQEDDGARCQDVSEASGASAMGLDMFGGVFLVVLLGIGLGVFVALFEFLWKAKRNPDDYKESLMKEAGKAFKQAFRSPTSRSKVLVRPSTLGQMRDDQASTAVPILPDRFGTTF